MKNKGETLETKNQKVRQKFVKSSQKFAKVRTSSHKFANVRIMFTR